MQTCARYLLIVSLAAVLLAGPVVSAPSLPRSCSMASTHDGVVACDVADHACCAACSGGEKACCHHGAADPQISDGDAGCGSCPLGQCECCRASQGASVVCVLPQRGSGDARLASVPLVTTDATLSSRSDEPLVPPPIA